jgi:hypothetical protein
MRPVGVYVPSEVPLSLTWTAPALPTGLKTMGVVAESAADDQGGLAGVATVRLDGDGHHVDDRRRLAAQAARVDDADRDRARSECVEAGGRKGRVYTDLVAAGGGGPRFAEDTVAVEVPSIAERSRR